MPETRKRKEKKPRYFGRSTLDVAKNILDNDKIPVRFRDHIREEQRLCFISLWGAANAMFKKIADLYEDPDASDWFKEQFEDFYKGIPVGWNLPLETRVPAELRKGKLTTAAEEARVASGSQGPIIVKGYNDPESLEEWDRIKKEREETDKPS